MANLMRCWLTGTCEIDWPLYARVHLRRCRFCTRPMVDPEVGETTTSDPLELW
jgi:hypothetical protein